MILYPRTCPECGSDLSTPIPSRRTGVVVQTCRNVQCMHTVRTSTPLTSPPEAPRQVSLPASQATERVVRPGALDRFERFHHAGQTKKAIKANRRLARQANATDGQLRRLGRDA